MTADEKQRIVFTISNLIYLVRELYPDPVYAEKYNVDEVIEQGRKAIEILIRKGE